MSKEKQVVKKKSLFNIESEYLRLAESIIENEGVLDADQEAALAINKEELETKAVNYALVIKSSENRASEIDKEVKRLQKMKKVQDNLTERLKTAVSNAMKLYEVEEIQGEFIKLNFRKSSAVIMETDFDVKKLPAKFRETVTTIKAKSADIKSALNAGEKVEGFFIEERKNLQIK